MMRSTARITIPTDSFAMPGAGLTPLSLCCSMMKDASLGIHYTEIGALTSIMPIAYGKRCCPA